MASEFSPGDTVDPLNLTFQPDISMDEDAQPDWSQFTNILMDEGNAFKFPPLGDMSSIPNDFFAGMDFNPAINGDSGALDYGGHNDLGAASNIFGTNDYSTFNTATFPFTFQQPDFSTPHPRRLSITSSSSSSGASNGLSPIMQPMSATPVESASPASSSYSTDPAEELAQRVIQSAGMMLAVPNSQAQQQFSPEAAIQRQLSLDSISHEQLKAAAAAITAAAAARSAADAPRPNHIYIAPSPPSTIKSSPSPTPPPFDAHIASSSSSPAPVAPGVAAPAAPTARPRTSHTTIERRYRTNLNTRIQSLRLVVPALRVLDKKKPFPEDTVDERGFIDGVKVARKCSKANVLGKAEEYIRVLKRREKRLVLEHNGLKTLLSGLVGGANLLKEWEKEWKAKYGGAEKDEIEGLGPMMEDSDDEEADGDEDDSGGDGEGRKRKKPKTTPTPAAAAPKKDTRPMVVVDGQVVPEKRKRGRPRKVVPDPAAVQPQPVIKAAEPNARPGQQYLLAVFAIFSFFNSSPSTLFSSSPSSEHGTHTGHVLSSPAATPHATPSPWSSLIQSFHLFISLLVFASFVTPWLMPSKASGGSMLRRLLTSVNPITQSTSPSPPQRPQHARRSRAALLAAIAPSQRGSPDEVDALRSALGADPVIFIWRWFGLMKQAGFEARGIEQRAWVRLGEIMSMRPSTSFLTRLQTYYCMSTLIPQFGACVSDLVTLSLVLFPIYPARARAIWLRAQTRAKALGAVRPCERLAVESLTLDEAARRLAECGEGNGERSPVAVLARSLVMERLEVTGKRKFVGMVLGSAPSDLEEEEEEESVKVTVAAAKSLGGHVAEMGDMLERVYGDSTITSAKTSSSSSASYAAYAPFTNIQALLTALLLYKQIFPSPSSATGPAIVVEDAKAQLELRRVLDEPVFEFAGECEGDGEEGEGDVMAGLMEDARDKVVDSLVEMGARW